MSEIAVAGTAAEAEVTATATNTKSEMTHNNMKRKKRLGKCARRRAQKARAISNASSSFASGCGGDDVDKEREWTMTTTSMTTSSASSVQVPSDRGYTLEGVKVHRREWRARFEHDGRCHNRCGQEKATSVSTTSTAAIDAFDEDNDVPLHPDDERALLSQLGYIPGNAICVAARLSSKEDALSSSHSSNTETSVQTAPQALPQPSVVKLYPMAARQKYGGGKSDGRAYKGRRRGAMRLEAEESIPDEKETESEKDSPEQPSQQQQQQSPTGKCKRKNEIQNNIIIEPFPTLYWLTHPQLHNQISKLELSTEYNVSKMEERLRSSHLYLQQMERAHLSYGRKRWELLTLDDRDYVLQCGWKSALDDSRGVAGIRVYKDDDGKCNDKKCEDENGKPEKKEKNDGQRRSKGYDCVKCLHAHVAHYLAQISEWEDGLKEQEVEEARKQDEPATKENITTSTTTKKECDWDDLNLVGKWVMEVVNSWDSDSYHQNEN
ncbi:hypothetical protein ACHAXH_006661 [Discostella pseudostelligera]